MSAALFFVCLVGQKCQKCEKYPTADNCLFVCLLVCESPISQVPRGPVYVGRHLFVLFLLFVFMLVFVCYQFVYNYHSSAATSAKRANARQPTRGSGGTSASAGQDTRGGSVKPKVRFQICYLFWPDTRDDSAKLFKNIISRILRNFLREKSELSKIWNRREGKSKKRVWNAANVNCEIESGVGWESSECSPNF